MHGEATGAANGAGATAADGRGRQTDEKHSTAELTAMGMIVLGQRPHPVEIDGLETYDRLFEGDQFDPP
jgi:hypothetical protein